MNKTIEPCFYKGEIKIPASKSSMQRAVAAALLSNGKTIIKNPDKSNDSNAALNVAKTLGATIEHINENITIEGTKGTENTLINVGESGLGIRMFSPIVSLFEKEITINGEGSLKNRPLDMIKKPLEDLGATVSLNNGFLPVKIKGKIKGGKTIVDGSTSSQFLTGLLMALPLAENDSVLEVTNLKSRPYIDLTINVLSVFGIEIKNDNYKTFYIKEKQEYKQTHYTVEGDWSSASFHIVGAAISGKAELSGLDLNSTQADKSIIKAVELFGAKVTKAQNIIVEKNKNEAFFFDATDCPDLFPPLAVLAAAANGKSEIKGISRLAHKESNRALVIQKEFSKLGINIELKDDLMIIQGSKPSGGIIHSNYDHRIAMAGAILALLSDQPITILESQAINKSYPDFFNDFENITQKK